MVGAGSETRWLKETNAKQKRTRGLQTLNRAKNRGQLKKGKEREKEIKRNKNKNKKIKYDPSIKSLSLLVSRFFGDLFRLR